MTISPLGPTTYSPKLLQQSLVRKQLSQGGSDYIGLQIFTQSPPNPSTPTDPDAGTLSISLYFNPASALPDVEDQADPRGTLMATIPASQITHEQTGVYSFFVNPGYTGQMGEMTAVWSYAINGVTQTYTDHFQILEEMPMYNAASEAEKFVVAQVTWRFADLFDSTEGGPNLTENFQTHFTYERITQLMLAAVQKFNFMAFPSTDYGLSFTGSGAMPSQFSGLLVWGTYIETLRHLIRSYVEIPDFVGNSVTYTNRRDYMQRWQSVLRDEEAEYSKAVTQAKRKLLSLGSGSLLVAGGIFGGSAGGKSALYRPGMQTSLERSWRFYPAAFSVNMPGIR